MAGPPSDADAAQLARILTSALAQNNAERQQAEAALASLTSREGYCLGLLAVLQAQGVPLSTKWLAAVQLKNNVTARWGVQPRGSQSAALTEGEKHHVREAALRLVGLPDAQLAVHLAVVVAKAARHDYPARWPALFERLCAPLAQRTAGRLEARRIWLTLHHVYKELASKRLPLDRQRFRDITARDLPLVWAAWRECAAAVAGNVAAALAGDAAAAAAVAEAFEAWMLQTKVLRRLLMAGVPRDVETLAPDAWLCGALPETAATLAGLLAHRPPHAAPGVRAAAMLDSALLKLFKLHLCVIQNHPWALHDSGALGTCLEAACGVVTREGAAGGAWPRLVAKAMTLASHAFTSPAYHFRVQLVTLRTPGGSEQEEAALEAAWKGRAAGARAALDAFWAAGDRRGGLLAALLRLHAPLSEAEVAAWREDGEAFYHAEAADRLDDEHRGGLDVLLREVVSSDEAALGPLVARELAAARAVATAAELARGEPTGAAAAALRRKEGIYGAACTLDYQLDDHVDFVPWLTESLLPELAVSAPYTRPLQRRCLLCIERWLPRCPPAARPPVYAALVATLAAPATDACVALTAVETARQLVEDWDFVDADFAPHLSPLLERLPPLLEHCEQFESQALVFRCVASIVERMGEAVRPHAGTILSWVPPVWQAARSQGLLRMQVLLLLQRLSNVLGDAAAALHPAALPILDAALDVQGEDAATLLEEALALWVVLMRNARAGDTAPLRVWRHWQPLAVTRLELAPAAMLAALSATLLGGVHFVQAHGAEVAEVAAHVMADLRGKALIAVFAPMLLLLQMFGADAVELLRAPLLKLLHLLLVGEEETLAWVKGSTVIARALVHCPAAVPPLFDAAAAAGLRLVPRGATHAATPPAASGAALLQALLGAWAERFDAIAQAAERKLCAMAFLAALALPLPQPAACFEVLMAHVTAVQAELRERGLDGAADFSDGDAFAVLQAARCDDGGGACDDPVLVASEDADGESDRRFEVSRHDPVRNVKLAAWAQARMREAHATHGAALAAAASTLPPAVSTALQAMLA